MISAKRRMFHCHCAFLDYESSTEIMSSPNQIPFSVCIAWISILIHTNQANYSDLSQGHPKCWFKGTPPPQISKKKNFRNYDRIIVFQSTSAPKTGFPMCCLSTMTLKRCHFSKALGDFDLWWQLQSEPSIRLHRLRGRKLHPGKVGLRLEGFFFTWYDENWKFDIVM